MPRGRHTDHAKADKQHRWNEAKILSSSGHVKIRVGKSHPYADPNGYAYEHLIVWVSAGRLPPRQGEVLHHRNEVKSDNRLENLERLTQTEHAAEHHPSMLSDAEVVELRQAYADGEDGTALAERFRIPVARAYKIIRGQARKSAGGPIQSGSLRGNANRNRAAGRLLDGQTWDEYPEGES